MPLDDGVEATSVGDTGPGISPEHLLLLCYRFYRTEEGEPAWAQARTPPCKTHQRPVPTTNWRECVGSALKGSGDHDTRG
jgi:hypothetical protein